MSSGFRAMLGVALGTFLIVVLAAAGAALGVAAFVGVQGPWPEGPVAQALAAFSRNGTLAVLAVVLLVILGCLPGIGPRSWASLNPIVRSTAGLRGITVSDLLDISVARTVGFVAAVAALLWAAPYAALDGPVTTAPVATLPAAGGLITALAAIVLIALPYAVAGLFSLRRESEFVDDYRIRPYSAEDLDLDDWRHLRDRESGSRRDRRPAPSATPLIEPLFPPGSLPPASSPPPVEATEQVPVSPVSPVAGAPGGSPSPSTSLEPVAATSSTIVLGSEVRQASEEPVLVFTVAADPADPVMVFSPASGVEPRMWVAPPSRRARPLYTPASRIKADDLLSPPVLFPGRRPSVVAAPPVTDVVAGPAVDSVDSVGSVEPVNPPKKRKKKKGKKGKKSSPAPVNVTVHLHMPPTD